MEYNASIDEQLLNSNKFCFTSCFKMFLLQKVTLLGSMDWDFLAYSDSSNIRRPQYQAPCFIIIFQANKFSAMLYNHIIISFLLQKL